MSHYNPNAGVSKTLIQHLIRFAAREGGFGEEASRTLLAVLATEISPELVPVGADGKSQSTEAAVGPYPAAGLQPLLPDPLRPGAQQDRLSRLAGVARCG